MSVRITCINKSGGYHQDLHHAISHLGWIEDGKTGKNTRLEIYHWLKSSNGVAYVQDRRGNKAFLYPRENAHGIEFLKTQADNVWTDNLLALPECGM